MDHTLTKSPTPGPATWLPCPFIRVYLRYQQQPIKYGEVASNVITPSDAALMQATENQALGQTQRGGPASDMQSAASLNRKDGLVTPHDVSNVVRKQGLSVSETTEDATRVRLWSPMCL
ncbi:hypothetical protein K1719_038933 [Acacia pycnantha]|nr:hypothetical protein K1719_038933 [Acacia pycnantha]